MILSYRPHKLLSFFIFSSVFLSVVLMGWFPLFYLPDHLFLLLWKAKVKVTQSCTTLCSPKDYIFHGIPQARIMEWVAIPFFKGSSQPRDQTQASHIAGGFFTIWDSREASYMTWPHIQQILRNQQQQNLVALITMKSQFISLI